jgi:hypothetical protein
MATILLVAGSIRSRVESVPTRSQGRHWIGYLSDLVNWGQVLSTLTLKLGFVGIIRSKESTHIVAGIRGGSARSRSRHRIITAIVVVVEQGWVDMISTLVLVLVLRVRDRDGRLDTRQGIMVGHGKSSRWRRGVMESSGRIGVRRVSCSTGGMLRVHRMSVRGGPHHRLSMSGIVDRSRSGGKVRKRRGGRRRIGITVTIGIRGGMRKSEGRSEWPRLAGKGSEGSMMGLGVDSGRVMASRYWCEMVRSLRGRSMDKRRVGRGMVVVLLRHRSGLVKVGCDLNGRHLGRYRHRVCLAVSLGPSQAQSRRYSR